MSPKIKHAYAELHDTGFAHSSRSANDDGKLVAGGFGVAVGRVFVTEAPSATSGIVRRDLGLRCCIAISPMGLRACTT